MGQWILNNFPLVFVLGSIGLSVFSWAGKKLKEQAERKKYENEQRRRQLEALRTGRDPEEEARRQAVAQAQARAQARAQVRAQAQAKAQTQNQPSASPTPTAASPSGAGRTRLEEIAARRQAQLAELRRRRAEQLARAKQGQGASTPANAPAAPPQSAPRPPARPNATAPARSTPRRPAVQTAPAPQGRSPNPLGAFPEHEPVEQHHLNVALEGRHLSPGIGDANPEGRHARRSGGLRAALSGPRLREAIVLTELLAPPVSLRENHLDAG
ncbi:MAG: hypothetical protein ACIARR_12350 [Phycisphaerales bacterium JB059]